MVDCTNIATLEEVQNFSKDVKVLTEVVTSNAHNTVQTDSTGKTHETLAGLYRRVGYIIVGDFSDVTKVEITSPNQVYTSKSVVGYEDALWRTNQTLPYMPTGSDPTLSPELGKWVLVGQSELKSIARPLNVADDNVSYLDLIAISGVNYLYHVTSQTTYYSPVTITGTISDIGTDVDGVRTIVVDSTPYEIKIVPNNIEQQSILDSNTSNILTNTNNISSNSAYINTMLMQNDLVIDDFLGEGETYYDNALIAMLTDYATYKNALRFLSKVYQFENPVDILVPTDGLKILGGGSGRTRLQFPNAAAAELQMRIYSGSDWYDFEMDGMSIESAHAGVLLQLGEDDFSDPLNTANISNLAILNSMNDNAAQALKLNYVVNSIFTNVRANCYADGLGANYGKALQCNQVQFCAFNAGSYGNASYGIAFENAYSTSNTFNAIDNENINIGIYNGSANSGLHTFIGGQFSLWQNYLLQAPTGLDRSRIHLINPNISSTTNVIDTSNGLGIRIQGVQWDITHTPTIPSSGVTYRNTTGRVVEVQVWGGTVSAVSIEGFGIGRTGGSFILRPYETIAITYSAAPSWYWRSLD